MRHRPLAADLPVSTRRSAERRRPPVTRPLAIHAAG